MRCVFGLICVCALSVMPLVGCSGGAECTRPLSDYSCFSRGSCPTYDEAVAQAAKWDHDPRPCGDTRLVVWSRNIDGGGSVLYFDDSDTLVAAETFGYGLDNCGGQILYGPVPDCPDEQWWRGSYCITCRGETGLGPGTPDVAKRLDTRRL
jgi:hypothetical protein